MFNGDADGICSLIQLRLVEPCDSQLVTGVKRNIQLLKTIDPVLGDHLNVLDVSFDKNRQAVEHALAVGASVFYVDHHYCGELPSHPLLTTHINLAADICTSLLVNDCINGLFAKWAVVGAFGDNLNHSALQLASQLSLSNDDVLLLEKLGVYINYNGYGAELGDLHFCPEVLFRTALSYSDPLDFIACERPFFLQLEQAFNADIAAVSTIKPEFSNSNVAAYILPNTLCSHRVNGVYGNALANRHPARGHAVFTEKANGHYLVSVRAPLTNKVGADELCRRFPSGGGRAAAAGVGELRAEQLPEFIEQFNRFYSV